MKTFKYIALLAVTIFTHPLAAMEQTMSRAEKLAKIKADAERRKAAFTQAAANTTTSSSSSFSQLPIENLEISEVDPMLRRPKLPPYKPQDTSESMIPKEYPPISTSSTTTTTTSSAIPPQKPQRPAAWSTSAAHTDESLRRPKLPLHSSLLSQHKIIENGQLVDLLNTEQQLPRGFEKATISGKDEIFHTESAGEWSLVRGNDISKIPNGTIIKIGPMHQMWTPK
jgi:hypothetical protein